MTDNDRAAYDVPFPESDLGEDVELHRLISCYEAANTYERRIVWAILGKYAPVCRV